MARILVGAWAGLYVVNRIGYGENVFAWTGLPGDLATITNFGTGPGAAGKNFPYGLIVEGDHL
jgi:hypothetical protein